MPNTKKTWILLNLKKCRYKTEAFPNLEVQEQDDSYVGDLDVPLLAFQCLSVCSKNMKSMRKQAPRTTAFIFTSRSIGN